MAQIKACTGKATLGRSWRCATSVCEFISAKLQIVMGSHVERASEIVTVLEQAQANALHADPSVVKLFLQEHGKYGCYSQNWGKRPPKSPCVTQAGTH